MQQQRQRERESICLTARYGVLLSRLPKTLLTQGWAPDMSPKPQSEVKCSTFKPACSDESTYASRCAQWRGRSLPHTYGKQAKEIPCCPVAFVDHQRLKLKFSDLCKHMCEKLCTRTGLTKFLLRRGNQPPGPCQRPVQQLRRMCMGSSVSACRRRKNQMPPV